MLYLLPLLYSREGLAGDQPSFGASDNLVFVYGGLPSDDDPLYTLGRQKLFGEGGPVNQPLRVKEDKVGVSTLFDLSLIFSGEEK